MPKQQPLTVSRIVGNLAAIIAVLLAGAFLVDKIATWLGGKPFALCDIIVPVTLTLGYTPAMVLGTVGFVMWAVQGFKGGSGAAMLGGAFLLGVIPMILPHYLGAAVCA